MATFNMVSFSRELPLKFRLVNWFVLVPILFWPMVLYMSIFLFDDSGANPTMVKILFFGMVLYPLYLIVLCEMNARLYKRNNTAAYIFPGLVLVLLLYAFGVVFF